MSAPAPANPIYFYTSGHTNEKGELRAAYLPNSTTAPPPVSQADLYTVKDNDADVNEAESDDELDNNVKKVLGDLNPIYNVYPHREGDTYVVVPTTAPTVQLEGAVKAWFDARSSDASLKIDPAAIQFEKQPNLGAGQFGTVSAAKMKRDGKDVRVAVKMLKSTAHAGSDADKVAFKAAQLEFLGEIKIMRRISKKNPEHCTKLLGVYASNGVLHAVLDFALVGSLDKFLRPDHTKATMLTDKDKGNILYQVARGLVEVHAVNVLHLDLAGRNCLAYFSPTEMEKGLQIKICDFGLAIKVPKGQPGVQLPPRCKPARTSPPEVWRDYATFKSDIYMFGCLIWEVLTDTDPHPNVPGNLNALIKLTNDVRDGKAPITPPPPVVNAGLGDLLKRCVNVGGGIPTVTADNMRNCIANRPTAKQVVQALEKFRT